jgi:hypothetical protein
MEADLIITNAAMIIWTFSIDILYFIHRRAAECAEDICFMFAVERLRHKGRDDRSV